MSAFGAQAASHSDSGTTHSPETVADRLFSEYLAAFEKHGAYVRFGARWIKPTDLDSGKTILAADLNVQAFIVGIAVRAIHDAGKSGAGGGPDLFSQLTSGLVSIVAGDRERTLELLRSANQARERQIGIAEQTRSLLVALTRKPLPYSQAAIIELLILLGKTASWDWLPLTSLFRSIARRLGEIAVTPEIQRAIEQVIAAAADLAFDAESRKAVQLLEPLVRQNEATDQIPFSDDDDWGAAAQSVWQSLDPGDRLVWLRVLALAERATVAKPTKRWLSDADALLTEFGREPVRDRAIEWLDLLGAPGRGRQRGVLHGMPIPTELITDRNGTLLRGLIWLCSSFDDETTALAVGRAGERAFSKIREIGARCTKAGNAALWCLGAMPGQHGAAQLVRLQRSLKQPSARSRLDATMESAAGRAGLTRAELEDQSVPDHNLVDGKRIARVGQYQVEIIAERASRVAVRWLVDRGTLLERRPELDPIDQPMAKKIDGEIAEIRQTLLAQRDRIERAWIADRSWGYAAWRGNLLDHALMRVIARPLIWSFATGDQLVLASWHEGRLTDLAGHRIDELTDETVVRLWHPIHSTADEVLAWRTWLEERQITQPFKQAHREVYLLTDAERETETYSNRFAQHFLRQHQFQALCRERGWRYGLQGMFDSAETAIPMLHLPRWGLKAEFWVEAVDDGDQTTAHGIYRYLTTDQVQFLPSSAGTDSPIKTVMAAYRERIRKQVLTGSWQSLKDVPVVQPPAVPEPRPLRDVPAIVLSEVMRDIDLFVGVASVGADPTIGLEAQHNLADYWRQFSFGELEVSARARREALQQVIPRLTIADRCSFVDRFLVVRGDLRTYKIHLGSGNILMDPNDQYLCIVPAKGSTQPGEAGHLYLPFEGDSRLAVILSKALLLARDSAISDLSILRQIRRAA